VDGDLRSLRRAARIAPADFSAASRLSVACERAGELDEAWDVLAPFEASDTPEVRDEALLSLGELADRNARWVFERLVRVDAQSARQIVDLLVRSRPSVHPALVALASDERVDRFLRRLAQRAVRSSVPTELREIAEWRPEALPLEVSRALGPGPERQHGFQVPGEVLQGRRERFRGFVQRLFDGAGKEGAVALLPWLVPFITSRDPELASQALALVRRLTDRDGPPFPVEVIARELGKVRI
jgi:hypothetical protein